MKGLKKMCIVAALLMLIGCSGIQTRVIENPDGSQDETFDVSDDKAYGIAIDVFIGMLIDVLVRSP